MGVVTGWKRGLFGRVRLVVCLALILASFASPSWALRADSPPQPPAKAGTAAAQAAPSLRAMLPNPPARPVSAEQLTAAGALAGAVFDWAEDTGVPRLIDKLNVPTTGDAPSAAQNFLGEIKDVFRMGNPQQEFALRLHQTDDLGFQHVRLRQTYQGLPVVGGELIVHFNAANAVYMVNGEYYPDISIPVTPGVSAQTALATGTKSARAGAKVARQPELVVYPLQGRYFLAYRYVLQAEEVSGETSLREYIVDAGSGAVLEDFDNRRKIAGPTANGVIRSLTGYRLAGEGGALTTMEGWYENTNATLYLYNPTYTWLIFNAATSGYTDAGTYATRGSYSWGTTDRTEVSLAANIMAAQQAFQGIFGRNSYDNASSLAWVNAHVGTNYVNAFWDPDTSTLNFGDGNGVAANSLAVLDVAAHEYAHAWTERTSNLIYSYESGALNESFSDIMGAIVEFANQGDGRGYYPSKQPGTADWLMGEDCWLSSTALRDMRNPRNTATVGSGNEQPSRYLGTYWYSGAEDNGGVHQNSGPHNFMFYLLTEGGSGTNDGIPYSVNGIGINNSRHVAYRANTYYMSPGAGFKAAHNAWAAAAYDINQSWVASVHAAFGAIGVIALPANAQQPFETPGLPAGWTTSGGSVWTTTTADFVDGVQSVTSGPGALANNGSSSLYWTTTTAAGQYIGFQFKVSSEAGYDFFNFYVDGVRQVHVSGITGWLDFSTPLSAGSHTFRWEYAKDSSVADGLDCVFVDSVSLFTPNVAQQPLGSLQLTITPASAVSAGAMWRVANTAWLTSGALVGSIPAGTYPVNYLPAAGWTPPANTTVTITGNATTNATATYTASGVSGNALPGRRGGTLLAMGIPVALGGGTAAGAQFLEPFTSNNANWTQVSGTWNVGAGRTAAASYGPVYYSMSRTGSDYTTLDYSVRLRRLTSASSANFVMVRGQPTPVNSVNMWADGYFFGFNNQGQYIVGQLHNGVWTPFTNWIASTAIVPYDWNTLRVTASGNTLNFYINGTHVHQAGVGTFSHGQVGFGMYGAEYGALDADFASLSTSVNGFAPAGAEQAAPKAEPVGDNADPSGSIR